VARKEKRKPEALGTTRQYNALGDSGQPFLDAGGRARNEKNTDRITPWFPQRHDLQQLYDFRERRRVSRAAQGEKY
jgi:hypothetical protein